LLRLSEEINTQIFLILGENPGIADLSFSNPSIAALHQRLLQAVQSVEELCSRRGAAPADLPTPSLRAYQWMHFLGSKRRLLEHLRACREFHLLVQTAASNRTLLKQAERIRLKLYPSSYLYLAKKSRRERRVEIHQGFMHAPAEIKQAIMKSALNGRTAEATRRIQAYARAEEFRAVSQALAETGQVNNLSSKGKTYDLAEIYERLNQEYFKGRLARPTLKWSRTPARRRLGYFEPDSGSITISRRLDRADVDDLLVEYILFHEMLHQSQGVQVVNGRRRAHTGDFKRAERLFKGYRQAQKLMKDLGQKAD
jgi:hypothetical protein